MDIKSLKYKLKLDKLLNYIYKPLPENINENFIIFIDELKGGLANNIWPVINMKWNKKQKLGLVGMHNKEYKFYFITDEKNSSNAPLFLKGTHTSIYKIYHSLSYSTYILRLYEETDKIHMFDLHKIKDEYRKYNKNLIKIYFYGLIQTTDNNFKLITNNTFEILKDIKTYEFNYIITKIYDTGVPTTNKEKYDYVINNLKFLIELNNNNELHSDYKISNIGWEDDMNVILIDYDKNTIKPISDDLVLLKNGKYELTFSTSYIPKYLRENSEHGLYFKNISEFNKFSVGGLAITLDMIDIRFSKGVIILPKIDAFNNITYLNTYTLSKSLLLDNINYDVVPSYTQIYNILTSLKEFVE